MWNARKTCGEQRKDIQTSPRAPASPVHRNERCPMTSRRICGAPVVLGTIVLLGLAGIAPVARAAPEPDGNGEYGWKNVVNYARCALLVFIASTPSSWSIAFFDCTRTYE